MLFRRQNMFDQASQYHPFLKHLLHPRSTNQIEEAHDIKKAFRGLLFLVEADIVHECLDNQTDRVRQSVE